jgi:hypothetical protein
MTHKNIAFNASVTFVCTANFKPVFEEKFGKGVGNLI